MALCFRIRPLETSRYNSRITFLLITSCTVASLGGFLFGYSIGISGGMATKEADLRELSPWMQLRVEEKSKHSSDYCRSGSHRARAYTASLYVAGTLGALVAAWFTHAFGRRQAMVAAGALAFAGSILAATGPTASTLVVGRLLLWFGVGVANQVISLICTWQ
ncbi:sugar transport protein MST1-like [Phoenix dactylifera]|uniref:Sugar transport protein MST1-like n=1 Tax=Phoenix dactylifera TaxID=42345 RepID=A0A8B8ZCY3_PHODC|nr:sugar transport protein MST1-like [Phoenix dactylifera]